jgi:hypothetical protein
MCLKLGNDIFFHTLLIHYLLIVLLSICPQTVERFTDKNTKLCGLSPRANYRQRDRRLSAKLVPTFVDRRDADVVSVKDLCGHILEFLDRSC